MEETLSPVFAGTRHLYCTVCRRLLGNPEEDPGARTPKSQLGMRRIYHQKTDRVDAHIFTCFLALAMRRTLSLWMKESGLGTAPDKLLAEMKEIRLRLVGTP